MPGLADPLQVSKSGTWHYSAAPFEVILPRHCDWSQPLQHKRSPSVLTSEDQY